MIDLLDQGINDPDWVNFQANDPAWNLKLAGAAVRRYCGWHIYPNIQQTADNLEIGSQGIIQLPSLYVTDVQSVMVQDPSGVNHRFLDPAGYDWYQYGTVEPIGWGNWGSSRSYSYGPDNWTYAPAYQTGLATVTFNSGYEEVPADIKGVAFELAQTNIEVSSGNVKEIQTPGFRLQLMQAYGANLNPAQKNRLDTFRLPAVK